MLVSITSPLEIESVTCFKESKYILFDLYLLNILLVKFSWIVNGTNTLSTLYKDKLSFTSVYSSIKFFDASNKLVSLHFFCEFQINMLLNYP